MGSWVSYGLGSENQNLPAFVVLISQASAIEYGPAAVLALVGQRVSAVQASGRAISAPAAIRCFISPTLPASTKPPAAACWMPSRS